MEIRPIQATDAERFIAFYRQLATETEFLPFTAEEVEEKAEKEVEFIRRYNDYKQVFIALEGEKITGYLGISRSTLARLTHSAKLTVGVLAKYHRQKVATKLLKFAEEWAKKHNIRRLELSVTTTDRPAVELFNKTGFTEEGILKGSFKLKNKDADEYLMAKAV